ncbi:MAG: PAS domain-containing sensor histidine kinase [Gemmatimonadota bacterium]|nr:PAS domain-containing sensor histidine kinase [Gemmatimonadota bacterium]
MKSKKQPASPRAIKFSVEEALRRCMQQAPRPFAVTRGAEHTLVYANSAFCRVAGIATAGAVGAPVASAFTGTEGPALTSVLDRAFREGVELMDERIDASSERASHWQCSVWPVIAADGQPEGLGIEIRESSPSDAVLVLQRQVAEQMLLGALRERRLADDAETANIAKTAFLRAMSHELRTPLNAIGGYIDLLDMGLRGPVTENQHADFARVRTNQQHLAALITEILNFARLGTGSVVYAVSDVNGWDALRRGIELVEPLIAQQGLCFDGISGDPSIVARADPEKVTQILVNLLSNAIKFTPAGGHIGAECAAMGDAVNLSISDTGLGIATEKLDAIFGPFIQLKEGLADREGGIGLGLALSRDLARAMKGDITVESTVGQGARFTLTLPRNTERLNQPT